MPQASGVAGLETSTGKSSFRVGGRARGQAEGLLFPAYMRVDAAGRRAASASGAHPPERDTFTTRGASGMAHGRE